MVGTTLLHYRVLSELGAGGMGQVYAAEDTKLHRKVALKILPAELAKNPEARARFEREATAVASLNHPNIVTIYSVEESPSTSSGPAVHFITMELVDGESLTQLIAGKGLALERFLELALPLADAVGAAHQNGITHRDLKPDNIMVGKDGGLRVLDFGLAKLAATQPDPGTSKSQMPTVAQTEQGVIVGTVAYMSPEQTEGKQVDPRSDVFSLGVVLYEMATGHQPFRGESHASTISAILRDTPPAVTELKGNLPPLLSRLIRRCLAKDPTRRYQVALEIRNELEELKRELDSGEALATSPGAAAATSPGTNRALVVALCTVTAVLLGTIGYFALRGSPDVPAATHGLTPGKFQRLTMSAGPELFPSLSPDGKDFVFASRAEGNWDIYAQRVGGQKAINLTPDSDVHDTQPAFSPDGDRIAYVSERDERGIFVMGATGESVRRVTTRGCDPTWAPDGERIAYTTECVTNPAARGATSELWIVDVESGEERRIDVEDAVQASWSPNGLRIAYWAIPAGSGQRDIWTVPAGGGTAVRVTEDAPIDWNPVWSPSGEFLYFSSDRGGNMSLWRVRIDEASGAVLGSPEPVTAEVSAWSQHISVAADGKRTAFASQVAQAGTQRVAFDPRELRVRPGTTEWALRPSPENLSCDPSPDGEWLACWSFGVSLENILVLRSDGSDRRQITDDVHKNRVPVWSPDGNRIAFYSNRSGSYEIWIVNPDGSGLRQLTDTPGESLLWPLWSPDGRRLAASAMRAGEILVFDPTRPWAEQTPEVIATKDSEGYKSAAWSWSADGRSLVGDRSKVFLETVGITLIDLESKSLRTLETPGMRPIWLNDSRHVITGGETELYLVDTTTGDFRAILDVAPDTLSQISTALSADNRSLYYTTMSSDADIWMLTLE